MQPDRYELQWARARMWRTRAPSNTEAKQKMRESGDPLDAKALTILDADQAAIAADLAARKAAGLYPYERPQSVIEAERKRAEMGRSSNEDNPIGHRDNAGSMPARPLAAFSGQADGGPPSGSAINTDPAASPALPALRTPAAFFARQLDSMLAKLRRLQPRELTREQMRAAASVSDGYEATKPGPLGGPCPVAHMVVDDRGVALVTSKPKQDGDDTPDIRRKAQQKTYAKRNREIAEWGNYPAVSTEQNARRGVDPE